MKVLHIITGLGLGGAESALYRLVTSNNNAVNVKHVVVSIVDFGVFGKRLNEAGIEVHMIGMPRGRVTVKGLITLWTLIRKINPDVVQTWMYHADLIGGVVARVAGYKNIIWGIVNFNLDRGAATKSTRWAAHLCSKLSAFVPKKIVSCSDRAMQAHISIGYIASKFVNIPLGYNLDEFKPLEMEKNGIRTSWGIKVNDTILGCVARWDPQKDHSNLLKAVALLEKKGLIFPCVLAGPGIDYKNTELINLIDTTVINGAKSNLVLIGLADNISALMSALDVHILSSRGEAFPNVVAEAMACGTPCIVTDVGDAAAIVGNTGWVVPPNDSVALASAIENATLAMNDKESWHKRKYECRTRIAENYSMDRMTNAYLDLWKSLL